MQWYTLTFDELSNHQLYDLLKLRCDIFIVEQTCFYPDLDDKDRCPASLHLLGYDGKTLKAYARLLAPGVSYPEYSSIGRVVTATDSRGDGLGHKLMQRCNQVIGQHWPSVACKISAQSHLQGFYCAHGFSAVGEGYLEDDIPHIAMIKP